MFCKHCGKELSAEAFMCPECGTPTTNINPTKPVNKPTVYSKKGCFSTIGFICSLIAFSVIVIFIALNCFTPSTYIYNFSSSYYSSSYSYFYESKYAYNIVILGVLPMLMSILSFVFCCFGLINSGEQQTKTQANFAVTGIVMSALVFVALILSCSICAAL